MAQATLDGGREPAQPSLDEDRLLALIDRDRLRLKR
jgi:hypothetical protein